MKTASFSWGSVEMVLLFGFFVTTQTSDWRKWLQDRKDWIWVYLWLCRLWMCVNDIRFGFNKHSLPKVEIKMAYLVLYYLCRRPKMLHNKVLLFCPVVWAFPLLNRPIKLDRTVPFLGPVGWRSMEKGTDRLGLSYCWNRSIGRGKRPYSMRFIAKDGTLACYHCPKYVEWRHIGIVRNQWDTV